MLRAVIYWFIRKSIAKAFDVYHAVLEWPSLVRAAAPDYSAIMARLEADGVERLALVAPHPAAVLTFTLRNLVKALLADEYTVIVLSCQSTELAWLKSDFPGVHVVPRAAHGRDFGAWKYFLLDLLASESLRTTLKRLILVNDSMYYNEAGVGRILDFFGSSDRPWMCVYENNEIHYHAQSFLLGFSGAVVRSAAFRDLWARYKPYSTRKHSIDCGEVGLSADMKAAFGMPDCYISSRRLLKALEDMPEAQTMSILECLEKSVWGGLTRFKEMRRLMGELPWVNGVYAESANSAPVKRFVGDIVVRLKETRNPSHAIGLISNQLFEAPIKRDICYRGVYRIAHLLQLSVGFSPEELEAIEGDLREKGLPESIVGVRRVLFLLGRI